MFINKDYLFESGSNSQVDDADSRLIVINAPLYVQVHHQYSQVANDAHNEANDIK